MSILTEGFQTPGAKGANEFSIDVENGPTSSTVSCPATKRMRRQRSLSAIARSRKGGMLLSLLSFLLGIVLWQLIGEFLVRNSLFLSTPIQTFSGFRSLWDTGALGTDVALSAKELLLGYLLGSLVGSSIGVLIAKSPVAKRIAAPYISGFYATPILALAPLLILWFGLGVSSKVVVVFSLVIFPQIVNTELGIRAVDEDLSGVVKAFGGTRLQLFMKVEFWSSLPSILAGLRLGVGRALMGVVVGEFLGARGGLGYAIYNAQTNFNMPQLFAGVVIFAVSGIVLTGLVSLLERRMTPWIDPSSAPGLLSIRRGR